MLSAGNTGKGSNVIGEYVCVCMVYMHASEVQYTYLMDINIKETIMN